MALHYPELVRGVYLWLVSSGPVGKQLGQNYYGQYAELAEQGGMPAVIESQYWSERIDANPANKQRLLAVDPAEFAAVMRRWQAGIRVDDPMFGATEDDLRRIQVRTAILAPPASDTGHPRAASERIAKTHPRCGAAVLGHVRAGVAAAPAAGARELRAARVAARAHHRVGDARRRRLTVWATIERPLCKLPCFASRTSR